MSKIIYALAHPRTRRVRYIGLTDIINFRLQDHLALAKTHIRKGRRVTAKDRWINEILRSGVLPEFRVIEIVRDAVGRERERRWVEKYVANGARLFNVRLVPRGAYQGQRGPRNRARKRLGYSTAGAS